MRLERFDTAAATRVQISVGSADLFVSTWDQPATEIEIDGRRADASTRELIDEFTVDCHPSGDGHVVTVKEGKKTQFGFRVRSPHVVVRVRCPENTGVNVASGSSDVLATGHFGPLESKSGSGDLSIEGSAASVRAVSASGDVRVSHVLGDAVVTTASGDVEIGVGGGQLTLNSVSGDVRATEANGEVRAHTVSGDVSVVVTGGGDIRAQTVSGDVQIALAAGVAVWIDAGSVSGDVTSNLEVDERPAAGDASVVELHAKSVSGDIEISRARSMAL